jgi:hypothetical protein
VKELHIRLTDCYGIGKLDHVFDFDIHAGSGHDNIEHSQTNIVYARNGIMKTSLAKALLDYSENNTPSDGLHGRTPHIHIEEDDTVLTPEKICVLRSSDNYFESKNMAMLLSNKKDQERYSEIMLEIEAATTELFEAVSKALIGRESAEKAIQLFDSNFHEKNYNRIVRIMSMESDIKKTKPELLAVDYKILDNINVTNFLAKPETQSMLKDYADMYEKVLQRSEYFQDGLFDYSNALKVHKSLKDNNFMKKGVGNKVIIVAKDKKEKTIDSAEELKEEYEKDKNKIFETLEKQVAYDKFDKEIGANPDLRGLQSWVRKNKNLVIYLQNYMQTKTLVWQAHFAENIQSYDNLLQVYGDHRHELDELIERSRSYESEWKNIVKTFKEGFRPKFDIQVRNQEDVVLKKDKPELVFIYEDDRGGTPKEVPVQFLNEHIFSTGERRALYILCMMFEVRVRMTSGQDTVLVLDDIADSFDYKNKYAIIEYLYDLSVDYENNIYMIVLTHNYDFFRSLRMRCQMKFHTSPKVFLARRSKGEITLNGHVYTDEFMRLKQLTATSTRAFLSLIPLARNIIEYSDGHQSPDYILLTNVMHNKEVSKAITVDQVIKSIQASLAGVTLNSHASTKSAQAAIIEEADKILSDGQDDHLEDKIILAMAIRIRAERYMKEVYIQDSKALADENGEQTGRWYAQFVRDYSSNKSISTLKLVNIVTPETLHINSFMYEPIIDMSIDELRALYENVKLLI